MAVGALPRGWPPPAPFCFPLESAEIALGFPRRSSRTQSSSSSSSCAGGSLGGNAGSSSSSHNFHAPLGHGPAGYGTSGAGGFAGMRRFSYQNQLHQATCRGTTPSTFVSSTDHKLPPSSPVRAVPASSKMSSFHHLLQSSTMENADGWSTGGLSLENSGSRNGTSLPKPPTSERQLFYGILSAPRETLAGRLGAGPAGAKEPSWKRLGEVASVAAGSPLAGLLVQYQNTPLPWEEDASGGHSEGTQSQRGNSRLSHAGLSNGYGLASSVSSRSSCASSSSSSSSSMALPLSSSVPSSRPPLTLGTSSAGERLRPHPLRHRLEQPVSVASPERLLAMQELGLQQNRRLSRQGRT